MAAFLLAGCEAPDSASSATATSGPEAAAEAGSAPAAAVASLAGEWRVAGIDGESLDEPYGIALRGDEGNLWWEPECAAQWRAYRIAGSRIEFSVPARFLPRDGTTPPVCAIGLPPRLPDVMRALDAAETIERTPQNGILIAGGGRSVTLFSQ